MTEDTKRIAQNKYKTRNFNVKVSAGEGKSFWGSGHVYRK